MGRTHRPVLSVVLTALVLVLLPGLVWAQTGSISGVVRDTSGGVLPGVTVEVSSPQLIEKVRSTVANFSNLNETVYFPTGSRTIW